MLSTNQVDHILSGLEAEILPRDPATHFTVRKLHDRSDHAWAVIEMPCGAIAENGKGELLLRLTKDEATTTAVRMTASLRTLPNAA